NNGYIRKERVKAIADAASRYYQNMEISQEELSGARAGLRPVSPDGLPYLGKTSMYNTLVIASGHAMIGRSLGAITGKLVVQVVADQETLGDLSPFEPARFR